MKTSILIFIYEILSKSVILIIVMINLVIKILDCVKLNEFQRKIKIIQNRVKFKQYLSQTRKDTYKP